MRQHAWVKQTSSSPAMAPSAVYWASPVRLQAGERWGTGGGLQNHHALWWCGTGSGILEPTRQTVRAGDCLLVDLSRHLLSPVVAGEHGMLARFLICDHPELIGDGLRRLNCSDPAFAQQLFDHLVTRFRRYRGRHPQVVAWLSTLLDELQVIGKPAPTSVSQSLGAKVRLLQRRIEAHPEYAWSVSGMAFEAGVTPTHLRRIFHALLGCSPKQWLAQVRMHATQELLLHTDHNLSTIAERVGICDAFQLSRQFRSWQGTSPSAYRKQHQIPHHPQSTDDTRPDP